MILYMEQNTKELFLFQREVVNRSKIKFNILQQVVLEKRTVLEQIAIIILQISQTASG